MIDVEAFEERAAIMEFDGGLSRFKAETLAAEAQGAKRHEVINEIRKRNSERQRNRNSTLDRKQRQDHVPGLQRDQAQEARSVSERNPQA